MEEVVEKHCGLTFAPGPSTTERCKLHYRNGAVETAEILSADNLSLQNHFGRSEAYLEVDGRLYIITEELPTMARKVRLRVPPWVRH